MSVEADSTIRAGHGTYKQKRLPAARRLGHAYWQRRKGLNMHQIHGFLKVVP